MFLNQLGQTYHISDVSLLVAAKLYGDSYPDSQGNLKNYYHDQDGTEPANVRIIIIGDEPGWDYNRPNSSIPSTLSNPSYLDWSTPPTYVQASLQNAYTTARRNYFKNYMMNTAGQPPYSLTQADFGVSSWDDLLPGGRSRTDPDPTGSGKKLYYWTMRFFSDSYASAFVNTINPILSRMGYTGSALISPDLSSLFWYHQGASEGPAFDPQNIAATGDYAEGCIDHLFCGRINAISPMFEIYPTNEFLVWGASFVLDIIRCSSMLRSDFYPSKKPPLGLIHPTWGTHPKRAIYSLLSLIGHGAKAVIFYTYGLKEQVVADSSPEAPDQLPIRPFLGYYIFPVE